MENPFRLEEKRDSLAKARRYKDLQKLYRPQLPEIPDFNTPYFWNKRNSERVNIRKTNPMAYDKYTKVAKDLPANEAILNIGAGSGNLEKQYFSLHKNIKWYGTDIAPDSIRTLKTKFPKAHFQKTDILALPFKNNEFNVVTILDVLEHIPPSKIFKALSEVKRVIKKNGILIVSVPLNEKLEHLIHNGQNPNAHVRTYTPELIAAELEIAGFTIKKKELLFAFGKYYKLKTMVIKYVLKTYRKPNLVIITATL